MPRNPLETSAQFQFSDEQQKAIEKEATPKRLLTGFWIYSMRAIAIAMALFHIYTAGTGAWVLQNTVHLMFAFLLIFITYPARKRSSSRNDVQVWDVVLTVLGLSGNIYYMLNFDRILYELGYLSPTTMDLVFGGIMVILVLEASRRTMGLVLPIIATVGLFYAYLGPYFPGVWAHSGFSIKDILASIYLGELGIYGAILRVSACVIAIFVIFGGLLIHTGGGDVFIRLAYALTGRLTGGPPKVAVISSMLFGMISGSTAANVATTGVFTIPLMKSKGYKPHFAAAVEAAASCGGQIMPPILGAAAFIMADILGISYFKIAAAALIPAILYYLGCWMAVQFEAKRLGIPPDPDAGKIPLKEMFAGSHTLFIPLILLIVLLAMMYTPTTCAFWAFISGLFLYLISQKSKKGLWEALKKVGKALEAGAYTAAFVASMAVLVQIVVAVVGMTGLAVKFSSVIIALSGQSLIIALLLGMVVTMILGMGVPTVAAYILGISIVAGAFINVGLDSLTAHFFIFYYGVLAGVTPPVALAAYVGSAIAGAHWFRTALTACRIGFAGFLVPFMFVYNPSLLGQGPMLGVMIGFVSACIGVIALSASMIGYLIKPANFIERALLFGAALALIDSRLPTDLIGYSLFGLTLLLQKYWSWRPAAATPVMVAGGK
ncbi:MAG: TRAP transporter fused permease subunit [Thermodesulfobacteriota bacterium]|nr:TRAP transporter fused permease subunit [Thermodesulfobacteriota bacterium]